MERRIKNGKDWLSFPCKCGLEGCMRTLDVAPGLTPRTISIGIRSKELDTTLEQGYLAFEDVPAFINELKRITYNDSER